MLVRLDLSSDVAIYDQIANGLGAQIRDGSLEAGQRLPPARALADSLDINVHTVLKGYARLELEGLVDIRRGRGGVVIRGASGVTQMARRLVDEAKANGISERRVVEMIRETW